MSPFIILWETRQRINLELSAFEDSRGFGVGQGPHKPPLFADEVDAQRKEAIKAKVGEQVPWRETDEGSWGCLRLALLELGLPLLGRGQGSP